MKYFSLVFFMLFCCNVVTAQSFEDYIKQKRAEFAAYKEKTQKEFDEYRAKINAEFADFMRKPWEKKEGNEPVKEPKKDIPDVEPVIIPDYVEIDVPDDNEIPVIEIVPLEFDIPAPAPVAPVKYEPKPKEKRIGLDFYGTECTVRFDMDKRKFMVDASENSAADMWEILSGEDYNNLLYDCIDIRSRLQLCDWAYYQLADSVANAVYLDESRAFDNEKVMLKAYIMSQSGYKIRLGRSDKTTLHLLVSINDDLYNYKYWVIGDRHYYLTDGSNLSSLYIFDREFPNETALRMAINSQNRFGAEITEPRLLKSKRYPQANVVSATNKNLIDFYGDYPSAYKRDNTYSHWSFYANTPLSDEVKERIYPTLRESIEGKSQQEAANIVINFVQTALEYRTDDQVWGKERTFFPDETLFYPYSDCEDRAILYTRIIRDLLGLECVLLYYPGHLASAVAFDEEISGDYIIVDGKKYLVCDPTYINATIGRTMPGMDNSKAVVIML